MVNDTERGSASGRDAIVGPGAGVGEVAGCIGAGGTAGNSVDSTVWGDDIGIRGGPPRLEITGLGVMTGSNEPKDTSESLGIASSDGVVNDALMVGTCTEAGGGEPVISIKVRAALAKHTLNDRHVKEHPGQPLMHAHDHHDV